MKKCSITLAEFIKKTSCNCKSCPSLDNCEMRLVWLADIWFRLTNG